jgi:hypothetical protein
MSGNEYEIQQRECDKRRRDVERGRGERTTRMPPKKESSNSIYRKHTKTTAEQQLKKNDEEPTTFTSDCKTCKSPTVSLEGTKSQEARISRYMSQSQIQNIAQDIVVKGNGVGLRHLPQSRDYCKKKRVQLHTILYERPRV